MSTYRDRREAKADRLRECADKREAKSQAAHERVDQIADMIPFGQPILVGHHSEGRARRDADRINTGMRQAIDHQNKADDFRRRADGIDSQLDRSIYSDDEDAVDRLRERIGELEAKRDQIKTANAAYRKEHKADLAELTAYGRDQIMPYPGYVLTNLSGNINRNKKRLAELEGRR